MKNDYDVKQCVLNKGNLWMTVWIPAKFAVKGKILRLKDDDGWRVDEVNTTILPYLYLKDISESYKNTRKVSDV
jgi:hypothetical protein